MCRLENLQSLNLANAGNRDCKFLKILPANIGELRDLQSLTLSSMLPNDDFLDDSLKQLPQSMSKLRSLLTLILKCLTKLKKLPPLPDSITNLDLEFCSGLDTLAETLAPLKKLKKLNVGNCGDVKSLPDVLGGLKELVELVNKRRLLSAPISSFILKAYVSIH